MLEELMKDIVKFRDDRNWSQYHNAKDLAISLTLEAAELLENFQWLDNEEAVNKNIENIKDELADIIIYSLLMSDRLNLDLETIIRDKLQKNIAKYPVEKAYGSNKKYDEL